MVRKKVEGNEEQRRTAARDARKAGERPSERHATTGASKQRTHVPDRSSLDHEEKTEPVHRGKQRQQAAERTEARERPRPAPPGAGQRSYAGRGHPDYGPDHEKVFQALGETEQRRGGEAAYAREVAEAAGLSTERTRLLLHDLVVAHRLVTELQRMDDPDLGPRYQTRQRR